MGAGVYAAVVQRAIEMNEQLRQQYAIVGVSILSAGMLRTLNLVHTHSHASVHKHIHAQAHGRCPACDSRFVRHYSSGANVLIDCEMIIIQLHITHMHTHTQRGRFFYYKGLTTVYL